MMRYWVWMLLPFCLWSCSTERTLTVKKPIPSAVPPVKARVMQVGEPMTTSEIKV